MLGSFYLCRLKGKLKDLLNVRLYIINIVYNSKEFIYEMRGQLYS